MTRKACAVLPGETVHIEPHDITYQGQALKHVDREAIVTVKAVIIHGHLAVICWYTTPTDRGATVYDHDDPIEVLAVA